MTSTSRIAIVTDSAASLPEYLVEQWGITVMDLTVDYGEGEVTTSGLTVDACARTFDRLLDERAEAVIAVTVASALSGSWSAATIAARDVMRRRSSGEGPRSGPRVVAVDSQSAAMGQGFVVLAAARAARDGATVDEIARCVEDTAELVDVVVTVPDLGPLRKGGRLSGAAAAVTAVLPIRPVLRLAQGSLAVAAKTRTAAKALDKMVQLVVSHADTLDVDQPLRLCVHYAPGATEELADEVVERLASDVPRVAECLLAPWDPVLAAHVGDRAVGVAAAPLETFPQHEGPVDKESPTLRRRSSPR